MGLSDEALVVQVCKLYYEQKMTQQEIARFLGISRTRIVRCLQDGLASGIVQIRVVDPSESSCQDLTRRLNKFFPLKALEIVPNGDPENPMLYKNLAHRAEKVFMNFLGANFKVGVGWGKSVFTFLSEFPSGNFSFFQPTWIPLIGGLGEAEQFFQVNELVRIMQKKMGGRCHSLHAPALVESKAIKTALLSDGGIQTVTNKWDEMDMAVFGIGAIQPREPAHPPLLHMKYLPEPDRKEILQSNAVGDILSRFFDRTGRTCEFESSQRIIGVTLSQLRNTPVTLAIVGGEHKAEAILGALRGKYINCLVTDESAAKKMLEMISKEGKLNFFEGEKICSPNPH
ncbi:MAG: sugar-binding transcriptional regulator [Atribacterota bacterium]